MNSRSAAAAGAAVAVALVFLLLDSTIAGALFAAIPYVLLARAGRHATPPAFGILLAALLAASAVGLVLAETSSTGGIAMVWIVPGQLVACFLLWAQVSERAGKPANSP